MTLNGKTSKKRKRKYFCLCVLSLPSSGPQVIMQVNSCKELGPEEGQQLGCRSCWHKWPSWFIGEPPEQWPSTALCHQSQPQIQPVLPATSPIRGSP